MSIEASGHRAVAALALMLALPPQGVAATCSLDAFPIDPGTGARIVTGSARLEAGCRYSANFVIQSPDTTLDCAGAEIGDSAKPVRPGLWNLGIRSVRSGGQWVAPHDVVVRNCVLNGGLRTYGIGPNNGPFPDTRNGGQENREILDSSHSPGHTARLQAAAPSRITVERMRIIGNVGSPVYIGPGVTYFTLRESQVSGGSGGGVIVLDSESAHNTIERNIVSGPTARENVSIDGSAYNRIVNNEFRDMSNGGIYLYRNCGENGVVRHQAPVGNEIAGNLFEYDSNFKATHGTSKKRNNPAVWLSPRDGVGGDYCEDDKGYPFGSSADNRDLAAQNKVVGNRIRGADPQLAIRRNALVNEVRDNVRVDAGVPARR